METNINRRNFLLAITGSVVGATLPENLATPSTHSAHFPLHQPDTRYHHLIEDAMGASQGHFRQQLRRALPLPDSWTLTLGGMLRFPPPTTPEDPPQTELPLSWEALHALPYNERAGTLTCIGNPVGGALSGMAIWGGARFTDLLSRLDLQAGVSHVVFTGADGYQTALEIGWLDEAVLAYRMNGAALPQEHGAPLRLFVPGRYGQKMPKWIQRIDFIDTPFQGYWESRGLSDSAVVQTHALIQSPPDRAHVTGSVLLQGVAFAGLREITRVEVRVDGGEWQSADLIPPPVAGVWTRWFLAWQPETPGVYQFEVRATDSDGFIQHHHPRTPFEGIRPSGASGIHRITLEVSL